MYCNNRHCHKFREITFPKIIISFIKKMVDVNIIWIAFLYFQYYMNNVTYIFISISKVCECRFCQTFDVFQNGWRKFSRTFIFGWGIQSPSTLLSTVNKKNSSNCTKFFVKYQGFFFGVGKVIIISRTFLLTLKNDEVSRADISWRINL